MVGVDTNILVRVLTNDDPVQARDAAALLQREEVWISRTVLLETEWVLRYFHGLTPDAIHKAFTMLLGLSAVHVEEPTGVAQALSCFSAGLDFADALHLSACGTVQSFVSFDRKLIKRARRHAVPVSVRLP